MDADLTPTRPGPSPNVHGNTMSAGLCERLKRSSRYGSTQFTSKRPCPSPTCIPAASILPKFLITTSIDKPACLPVKLDFNLQEAIQASAGDTSKFSLPLELHTSDCLGSSPCTVSVGGSRAFPVDQLNFTRGEAHANQSGCLSKPQQSEKFQGSRSMSGVENTNSVCPSFSVFPDLPCEVPRESGQTPEVPRATLNAVDSCSIESLSKQVRELKERVKRKEETLRKLKMVKMYRTKNDLCQLEGLVLKWKCTGQEALQDLWRSTPEPRPTMSELLHHLQIDPTMVDYDPEEDSFS